MAPAVYLLALLGLMAFHVAWMRARSRLLLADWAADNGYEVRRGVMRLFRTGPFIPPLFTGAPVLHVSLTSRSGKLRQGYALCGDMWFGLFARKVEVHFES